MSKTVMANPSSDRAGFYQNEHSIASQFELLGQSFRQLGLGEQRTQAPIFRDG